MKKLVVLGIALFTFFGPACVHKSSSWTGGHGSETSLAQASSLKANVFVVVIDGVRYQDVFGDSGSRNMPFLDKLAMAGTSFSNFKNDGLTKTNPGHASILTGTWQHIANDGSERPEKPTIFEYVRSQRDIPKHKTWLVAGKRKLEVCAYSTHAGYGLACGASVEADDSKDIEVFEALISHLEADHPQLVMVNFADVDRKGHGGKWPEYIDAIRVADSLTHEVWRFLQDDAFYRDNTYLFVTNDHGRHDDEHGGFKDHGCSCDGCRHIMCLVLGPDVKKGRVVEDVYTMIDICPTVGNILDTATPYAEGRVMKAMFAAAVSEAVH